MAARPEVDPARVAVMGYSFGGYQAPRVAAFDHRYAACVAFGAMHWSIYEWVAGNKARLAKDPRTSSTSIFQFRWVVGAPDNETALERSKKFTLEGAAQNIECAFLVLHGENDRIVPLEAARRSTKRSAPGASTSRSSPPRRAARSTARSTIASWASTISATGCSRTCSWIARFRGR